MRSHSKKIRYKQRRGITLLEILLATSVLVVGLMMAIHTTRSAMRTMAMARELTEAQNACQAVLNELLARTVPIEPSEGIAVEHLPDWRIRVDIYPASQPGLYVLHLSAHHFSSDAALFDARYELLRWVPAERVRLPESLQGPAGLLYDEFESLF